MIEALITTAEPEALDQATIKELRQRALSDFYFFAKAVCGFDWLVPHIHGPLCLMLEDYEHNTRLRLTMPRGWLKSTVVSIAYPLWRACNNPLTRVLLAQNTFTNACKKLNKIADIVLKNQLFKALFPELMPTKNCTWKTEALELNRSQKTEESTFEAAGIRTQVTSRHYDIIIEDDTVAPELDEVGELNLTPTKDDIDQAIGWHRLATPLLVNPKTSQIIVVGTRWFELDLLSWIEKNELHYKAYVRACLENELGEPDENGEPPYPERFDREVLSELRAALGPYLFSCLYLNKPIRSEDMIFRLEWFKYYETEPQGLITYTTVDPAGNPEDTRTKDNDYNVVVTTGKDVLTGKIYVLDYTKARCNPGALISSIFDHVRKWHPVLVAVEGNAYQHTLGYWIRERMKSDRLRFNIEFFSSGRSKSSGLRIPGLQPLIETGTLMFRPWMQEAVQQALTYPFGGGKVDIIDCIAFGLPYWKRTISAPEIKITQAYDPMTFASVLAELEARNKPHELGVMDVLYTNSDLCLSHIS